MCLCLMHLHASTQHSNRFDACSRGGSGQQPHPSCRRAAATRRGRRHKARWACGPRVTVPGGARPYIFDSNEFRAPFFEPPFQKATYVSASSERFGVQVWFGCASGRPSDARFEHICTLIHSLEPNLHVTFVKKARKFARSISALSTCGSPALPCRRQQLMDGFPLGQAVSARGSSSKTKELA